MLPSCIRHPVLFFIFLTKQLYSLLCFGITLSTPRNVYILRKINLILNSPLKILIFVSNLIQICTHTIFCKNDSVFVNFELNYVVIVISYYITIPFFREDFYINKTITLRRRKVFYVFLKKIDLIPMNPCF